MKRDSDIKFNLLFAKVRFFKFINCLLSQSSDVQQNFHLLINYFNNFRDAIMHQFNFKFKLNLILSRDIKAPITLG